MNRTQLMRAIRNCEPYEAWRRAVFIRDRFTCQQCGARNGRRRVIEADHIKPLSQVVTENNILSLESALLCPVLWDVANGRTLCYTCHEKTESYPKGYSRAAKFAKRHARKN